ncbi:hypothetical protein [Peptostreptococcus equinus]|uniref:DUF2642 domain-containing protein n=1 Tax=Peptostreptococcus equinus TaxID=3003601 RepID=A0ABY7JRL1_9FIRM|nr:hypothetical protein [Peptostreptococcus sp. CBA3647]WAW15770.1 hypothetical protein O0R46_04775 [Peptostreptococcus sp. CBA3647]
MLNKNNKSFKDFVSTHHNAYVELDSYISQRKLYGIISDYDDDSLTITHNVACDTDSRLVKGESFFIPMSSIKSIRTI